MGEEELYINYNELDSMFEEQSCDHDKDEVPADQAAFSLGNSPLKEPLHRRESYNSFQRLASKAFATENRRKQSWHDVQVDKPERQLMIIDISQLLRARKKEAVSQKWLQQLPHKVQKLERRLYHGASSLKEYTDRATLKSRLQKIATDITAYFLQAKMQRQAAAGRPRASEKASWPSSGQNGMTHGPATKSNETTAMTDSSSLRDILLAHTPTHSNVQVLPAVCRPEANFAVTGMLHCQGNGEQIQRRDDDVIDLGQDADDDDKSSVASSIAMPLSLDLTQHFAQHPVVCYGNDEQQHQQQLLLQAQVVGPDNMSSYHVNGCNHSHVQHTDGSVPALMDLGVPGDITSQLLLQQQHILRNIRQQEEMIRHLQNGQLQLQHHNLGNQSGEPMSGSHNLTSGAIYTPIQLAFLQQQEQQRLRALPYEHQHQHQHQPAMTHSGDFRQSVLGESLLSYQQGFVPQQQLARESQALPFEVPSHGMLTYNDGVTMQEPLPQRNQLLMSLQQMGHSQSCPRLMVDHDSPAFGDLPQSHLATRDARFAAPFQQQRPDDNALLALGSALMPSNSEPSGKSNGYHYGNKRHTKTLSRELFRW